MFTSTLKIVCESGHLVTSSMLVCDCFLQCLLINWNNFIYAVLSAGCASNFLDGWMCKVVLCFFCHCLLNMFFFATAYLIDWAQSTN